jgi:hypothetical protein
MRLLAVPAASLLISSSLLAQTAAPVDVQTMLAGLQQIKDKQSVTAKRQLGQTLSDFKAACADDGAAISFYEQAIDVTRFVGRQDADMAFDAWKKAVIPRMNPDAVRTALWYTTISVQRAAGATDEQIFPSVLAYAEAVQPDLASLLAPVVPPGTPPNGQAQGQRGERRGERGQLAQQLGPEGMQGLQGLGFGQADPGEKIMQEEVSQNVFAKWYTLTEQLSGLQNWNMVPADIDGIYTQFLLPIMRKNHDPRILDYWDTKIMSARGAASDATAAFNADAYNSTTRPTLLWSRAEDEIVIGQRDQGLNDMYSLVKNFPAHPDAKKWITELEGLLTTPPTVAAGGGAAPAAPQ